jgi:hypothetical protein
MNKFAPTISNNPVMSTALFIRRFFSRLLFFIGKGGVFTSFSGYQRKIEPSSDLYGTQKKQREQRVL